MAYPKSPKPLVRLPSMSQEAEDVAADAAGECSGGKLDSESKKK